jgi:peptidoglycan/xylan/chitin deacetylase (PgdA/CDA1 family)
VYPNIGSDPQPSYIPNDVLIITFHDGPTGDNLTDDKLAYLDAHNLHADFFLNTDNFCDISTGTGPAACIAELVDILKLHNPTNHTEHHADLENAGNSPMYPCPNASCVDSELSNVESVINTVSMGARPHLTRIRPPYGSYVSGSAAAAEIEKYGVALGENIDPGDWALTNPTGAEVANALTAIIKTPTDSSHSWGVVGFHVFVQGTTDALPLLFDPVNGYIVKNGFRLGSIEDVVCWKFGMHSWDIINQLNPGAGRGPN